MSLIKYGSFVSMTVLLVAVYIKRSQYVQTATEQLDTVLDSLRRAERKAGQVPQPARPRIAIGLGACRDGVTDALSLLERLQVEPPEEVKHHGSIEGKEELSETFAFFFSQGAAGERYIHDKELFEDILNVVEQIPNTSWYVGGNAPAMANRLAKEGCDVLLGARMSERLRGQLHEGIKVVGAPLLKDDVHLLMEYKTGEVWGKYKTPRANRLNRSYYKILQQNFQGAMFEFAES